MSIRNLSSLHVLIFKNKHAYLSQKSIMNTKLTLTLDNEVIDIAKKYAKEKGQSLSELVENYFKLITSDRRQFSEKVLAPKVKKLRGIIKSSENIDYKNVLTDELLRKYGH